MTEPVDVLTAGKAKAVAFDTARKGYDTDQVDAFIDHVCHSLSWYANELDEARANTGATPVVEPVAPAEVAEQVRTEYVTDPDMEAKVAEAVSMAQQAHTRLIEQNELLAQKDAQIAELQDALDLAKMAPPATEPVEMEPVVSAPTASPSKSAAMVLQRAQDTADQVMADAEQEAAALLDAAKGESEQVKAEASAAAEELRSTAAAEAERVRSEAQMEADRLLGDAQSQATEMVNEAEGKVHALSAKISDLSETEASYRRQLHALLDRTKTHLNTPIVLDEAPTPVEDNVHDEVAQEEVVVDSESVPDDRVEAVEETIVQEEHHDPQPPAFGDWVHHSDDNYSNDQGYLGN